MDLEPGVASRSSETPLPFEIDDPIWTPPLRPPVASKVPLPTLAAPGGESALIPFGLFRLLFRADDTNSGDSAPRTGTLWGLAASRFLGFCTGDAPDARITRR